VAEELLDKLRALLRSDPVPEVRQEAARAVSVAGDSPAAAVDALVAALDDANVAVRRAAILALGRVRDERASEALLAAVTTHPELWQETSAALAVAGTTALVPRLLPLLDHENTHVRCGAIRAVAALSARETASEPLFVYEDEEGHRHPLF
jgi:HEAT repeat protein